MKFNRIVLMMLAALALVLTACQSEAEATPAPDTALEAAPLVAEGRLAPAEWQDIAFASAGRVAEILAAEGDMVESGQVIARLEVTGQEARLAELARAEAEALSASQALQALEDNNTLAQLQAEANAASFARQIDDTLQAIADEEEKDEEDRNPLLIAEWEARLTLLEAQAADAEATANLLSSGPDPDAVAAAQARLDAAQAAIAAVQAGLAPAELTAPFAGTLTNLNLKIGQVVSAGAPVATVADLDAWVIETTNLTEIEVVEIAAGDTVTILLDALPDAALQGKIRSIATRYVDLRGDITYLVTIDLSSAAPQARWGMTAVISFDR